MRKEEGKKEYRNEDRPVQEEEELKSEDEEGRQGGRRNKGSEKSLRLKRTLGYKELFGK